MASPNNVGEKLVNLYQLNMLAGAVKDYADGIGDDVAQSFKSVSVSGHQINFYTNTSGTGTAAASIDFPRETFLDAAHTTLVNNFSWSNSLYPGSTNPNLNGQKVLVLAVKTTESDGTTVTTDYSFVSVQELVDNLSVASGDSQKVLAVNNNVITFKVSATANNALTVNNDGLYVTTANKINTVSGANGKVGVFNSSGQLTGGVLNASIVTADYLATNTEVQTSLNSIFS